MLLLHKIWAYELHLLLYDWTILENNNKIEVTASVY